MGTFDSNTKANLGIFDTESVMVDRQTKTGTAGQFTYTVIYSGACDSQSRGGSTFLNPQGNVDVADASLVIDPDDNGNLPQVQVGDRATVTMTFNGATLSQTVYNVVNISAYTGNIPHLELTLKRGPLTFTPKR